MSAVETAVEQVRALSEEEAQRLLAWLRELKQPATTAPAPGAAAVKGFARRYRPKERSTADWLKELREGEN